MAASFGSLTPTTSTTILFALLLMKRYPKGRHAATPFVPDALPHGFRLVDGKRLAEIMVRAYNRPLRWVRHRTATRYGVTSPFAQLRLRRLQARHTDLNAALLPFRGMANLLLPALAGLLDDPDCRPSLVRDTQSLRRELDYTVRDYYDAYHWLQAFKPGFFASSPERQAQMELRYLGRKTSQLLNELQPLHEEAVALLTSLAALRPTLFPFPNE
jgi:hypothetical protein